MSTRTCLRCGTAFVPSGAGVRHCSRSCSHRNTLESLWACVKVGAPDECWPCTGWRDRDGYGKIVVDGRAYKTHRLAFQLGTGRDPGSLNVLHRCDNPPCCNPAHLFLGTQADNIRDMCQKGRHPHGSRNHQARVTEAEVVAIRQRRAAGEPGSALAVEFGLSEPSVSDIYRRRTWRHVA